ncbi:hypothetical protein [Streptomyces sp. V1I1]|uniref:hypothetical protein n=1 Tax=Streptomyces sp. V1I1 TaxID=3042272 RepID=UPI0027886A1C|nr:hypothetical protein [Streptomyces sp. V1I1]MDQ0942754.1 hypothetical protein [Streptomyces sp. V1I1]
MPLPAEELATLSRLPSLRDVTFAVEDLWRQDVSEVVALPGVTRAEVTLYATEDFCTTEHLRRMLPALRELDLRIRFPHSDHRPVTLDLSPLSDLSDVSVDVEGLSLGALRVIAAEQLPHGSVVYRHRPCSALGEPRRAAAWWRRRFGGR